MGLSPETFWNMTLLEWRAALAGYAGRSGKCLRHRAQSLSRSELFALIERYPDTKAHG